MTTIYLARHGESDWNVENRFQGHTDRPLTSRGREQAEALAGAFVDLPLDAIYSSPLRRARETAETVAAGKGLPVVAMPELAEIDVGSWAGLSREEVERRFPEGFARWRAGGPGWDDGESYEDMAQRAVAALERIAAEHPDECVLVVAHGGPIRAIHAAAVGTDVQTYRRLYPVEPNARLSSVAVENGRISRLD